MAIRGNGSRGGYGLPDRYGSPGGYGTKGPVDVPLSSRPPQGGLYGCLSCVAVFAVVMTVVVVVVFIVAFRHLRFGPASAPAQDVRAVARSAAVSAASATAAGRDAVAMDDISDGLGADRIGADALDDSCDGQPSGNDPKKAPVVCARITDRLLGGRSDGPATMRAVDRALRSDGWRNYDTQPSSPPVSKRQVLPDMVYVDRRGDRLTVQWSTLTTAGLPRGSSPAPSPGAPLVAPADVLGPGFRSMAPGPSDAAIADAYAHHPFLVRIEVRDWYWRGTAADV